jgi:hypothetical protein
MILANYARDLISILEIVYGKLNQNHILLEAFSFGTQFLKYRMPSRTFLNEITGRPVVLFAFSGGSIIYTD